MRRHNTDEREKRLVVLGMDNRMKRNLRKAPRRKPLSPSREDLSLRVSQNPGKRLDIIILLIFWKVSHLSRQLTAHAFPSHSLPINLYLLSITPLPTQTRPFLRNYNKNSPDTRALSQPRDSYSN